MSNSSVHAACMRKTTEHAIRLELRFMNGTLMMTLQKFVDCTYVDAACDLLPNLWGESPDLNPVTTNGCELHGHFNANLYSQPNIITYLSRRYCYHIYLHYYGVTFAVTANSQEQRSPYFCDACRLHRQGLLHATSVHGNSIWSVYHASFVRLSWRTF